MVHPVKIFVRSNKLILKPKLYQTNILRKKIIGFSLRSKEANEK